MLSLRRCELVIYVYVCGYVCICVQIFIYIFNCFSIKQSMTFSFLCRENFTFATFKNLPGQGGQLGQVFSGHQRHFQVQIYVFPGKPLVQNANFHTIQCYFFAVFTCSLTFVYTNKSNFLVTSKLIYTVISIDTYQNEIIFKDFRLAIYLSRYSSWYVISIVRVYAIQLLYYETLKNGTAFHKQSLKIQIPPLNKIDQYV